MGEFEVGQVNARHLGSQEIEPFTSTNYKMGVRQEEQTSPQANPHVTKEKGLAGVLDALVSMLTWKDQNIEGEEKLVTPQTADKGRSKLTPPDHSLIQSCKKEDCSPLFVTQETLNKLGDKLVQEEKTSIADSIEQVKTTQAAESKQLKWVNDAGIERTLFQLTEAQASLKLVFLSFIHDRVTTLSELSRYEQKNLDDAEEKAKACEKTGDMLVTVGSVADKVTLTLVVGGLVLMLVGSPAAIVAVTAMGASVGSLIQGGTKIANGYYKKEHSGFISLVKYSEHKIGDCRTRMDSSLAAMSDATKSYQSLWKNMGDLLRNKPNIFR